MDLRGDRVAGRLNSSQLYRCLASRSEIHLQVRHRHRLPRMDSFEGTNNHIHQSRSSLQSVVGRHLAQISQRRYNHSLWGLAQRSLPVLLRHHLHSRRRSCLACSHSIPVSDRLGSHLDLSAASVERGPRSSLVSHSLASTKRSLKKTRPARRTLRLPCAGTARWCRHRRTGCYTRGRHKLDQCFARSPEAELASSIVQNAPHVETRTAQPSRSQ